MATLLGGVEVYEGCFVRIVEFLMSTANFNGWC